ncbi:dTDP-glucose 4,6-dehydratase, partial [bacterium]|nr:dTDP-glucose 4,6-dehydratase [bacterium]
SRIDLCDSESVQSLLKKEAFDIVFHLAAESHVDRSLYAASTFASTNVLGTQHLIDGALANSCRRFIHVSTDEVYGSMDEDQRADEQYPLLPSSPYSASKAASDLMVLAAHRTHGLPAVVTRCTNNYGGYQFPEKFIPLFITRAMQDERLPVYGDGLQQRSWIHTDDHCRAILSLAESSVVGEVFNIGGPRESERTNISVAQEILRILGKDESLLEHVTDRPAHDRKYAVESRALSELTGWKPEVEFQEGLEKTVAWYQEHEGWWRAITSGEYQRFYEQHYVGQ